MYVPPDPFICESAPFILNPFDIISNKAEAAAYSDRVFVVCRTKLDTL